jgi:branched-chain amino acid transport system ATP-binding protein
VSAQAAGAPDGGTVLAVEGLSVHYGPIHAVKAVSFGVARGSIVTLIGANGAGKSSTLRAITGLVRPSAGRVLLEGEDVSGLRSDKVLRRGAALVPEGRGIFAHLSVRENVLLGAFTRRDRAGIAADLEHALDHFPILRERLSQKAGTLSGGEQQMLAMARALMSRPKVLLLDEPSLGLAPMLVRKIYEIVAQVHAEGMTILLVEQNAQIALGIADVAHVIEVGSIVLSGPAESLMADEKVRAAYLGG